MLYSLPLSCEKPLHPRYVIRLGEISQASDSDQPPVKPGNYLDKRLGGSLELSISQDLGWMLVLASEKGWHPSMRPPAGGGSCSTEGV